MYLVILFPRAWPVRDHRALDEKSIFAILSGKEFNPRKEVLLEEGPGGVIPPAPFSKVGTTRNRGGRRGES